MNGKRDYLYYDVWVNEHPDVLDIIGKFQQYYDSKNVQKGGGDIEEVIITITRPMKLTNYDGWIEGPGNGNGGQDGGHLASGGNGGFGGGINNPPIINNPCEKAKNENEKAKTLLEKTAVSNQKTELTKTLGTDTNEKSFSFGKDSNGNYKVTDIITSTNGNSVGVMATSSTIALEGGIHTHTSDLYNSFSAGDFYAFQQANAANPNFNYFYVFGAGNSAYVMTITNPIRFKNLSVNYPMATYFDVSTGGWKQGTSIYNDFYGSFDKFKDSGMSEDEAFENAIALVMSTYDMGISLSKKDTSGVFKSIFVKEKLTSLNIAGIIVPIKTYEKTTDCNLK